MHIFGRVTLGLLFPAQYAAMAAACGENGEALQFLEAQTFPLNHAAAMARILQSWSVPPEIYQPLPYLLDDFDAIARFSDPLRAKIELVKLSVLLGWIAAGPWEAWDLVELVPERVLTRLHILDPVGVIHEIRKGLISAASETGIALSPNEEDRESPRQSATREIGYQRLCSDSCDLLTELFDAMGLSVAAAADNSVAPGKPVLVNCFGASAEAIQAYCTPEARQAAILVGNRRQLESCTPAIRTVCLPASYAALRTACEAAIVRQ